MADPLSEIVIGADPNLAPAVRLANIERRLNVIEAGRSGSDSSIYLEALAASQKDQTAGGYLTDFPVGKLFVPSADAMLEFYFELIAGAPLTGALAGGLSLTTSSWVYCPDGAGFFIPPRIDAGTGGIASTEQYVATGPSPDSTYKGHRLDTIPNQRSSFVAMPARQIATWTGLTFPGVMQITTRTGSSSAGAGTGISARARRLWARARS